MPSATLSKLAAAVRQLAYVSPYTDADAVRDGATLIKFRALERLGLARIRVELDEDFDPSDYEYPEDYEGLDAFGTVAEFRLPARSGRKATDWQHADSCWGHVGYDDPADPHENPYVLDEMAEAVAQFNAAWKAEVRRRRDVAAGRCPECHGTGRLLP